MKLALVTAPSGDVVSVSDAKAFARVDLADEDSLMTSLVAMATQNLDGRDGLLGRALLTQTWAATFDRFHCNRPLHVPLPPCQSVTSVTYIDRNGATQTLDPASYRVAGIGTPDGATIEPALNAAWPDTAFFRDCITVTFVAGYGNAASSVPEAIKTAIKMHAGALFEGREISEVHPGYFDLIAPYRTWGF
jgi:uncharacterized phiE125 gp8 family phage protein